MKASRRLVIIAASLAFAACASVEEVLPPDTFEGLNPPVSFTASVGIDSKTTVDGQLNAGWAAGDKLTVFDADGRFEEFTVTEDCSSYSFTTAGVIGEGPYYAVAGYGSDALSFDSDLRRIGISRPSDTTDGSFSSADVVASTTEGTSFTFHHVFALLKMSIASDDITSITFVAEGLSASEGALIGFGSDGSIDAVYDGSGDRVTIEGITGPGTFYIAVNPGTYDGGFSIHMQKGDTHMMVESDKAFTASCGTIVNFGTLDTGTPSSTVWQLVTDVNGLSIGDEFIIAASDYNYALGSGSKNQGRAAVPVVKSQDGRTILATEDGVLVLTLTEGKLSGTFGMYTGTAYLRAGGSEERLGTTTNLINASSWSLSIGSDGTAAISSRANGNYYRLTYNASTEVFNCFNPTKQGVSIYRKVFTEQQGPQMVEENAFLDETEPGAYSYDSTVNSVSDLYRYVDGTDQHVLGEGAFRIQNLASGKLAGVTLDPDGLVPGNVIPAGVTLYGIDGYDDGTVGKTFKVKKTESGKAWLQEEGGTLAFIIII